MLVRDAPAGDWAAVTKVLVNASTNNILAGIGVTFATADHFVYLELIDQISEQFIYLGMSDGGAVSFVMSAPFTLPGWCYLRLRYDDSEALMVGEYSLDGLAWTSVQLDISGLGEAPDAFGVSLRPWGAATAVEADFEFFRVVEAFGASTDPIYGDNGAPLALDAGQVGYTPATGADWTDPDPTTVQAALDALAEAVVAGDDTLDMSNADVSSPPTSAELESAFGAPATVGAGYTALLDDGGAGSAVYLVASDGTSWWYTALTKAT